jgi:hypothetical protein
MAGFRKIGLSIELANASPAVLQLLLAFRYLAYVSKEQKANAEM